MYNKTIIEFGFCDIRNNQSLDKFNQPQPPASADYTCLDLDYSGYHKNRIQLLFYYTLFMENIQKLLCVMQADFICACKNTRTNTPSGRITRNHSSARAL